MIIVLLIWFFFSSYLFFACGFCFPGRIHIASEGCKNSGQRVRRSAARSFNVYKMARCKHVYVNAVYSLRKRKQLSLPAQVSV